MKKFFLPLVVAMGLGSCGLQAAADKAGAEAAQQGQQASEKMTQTIDSSNVKVEVETTMNRYLWATSHCCSTATHPATATTL